MAARHSLAQTHLRDVLQRDNLETPDDRRKHQTDKLGPRNRHRVEKKRSNLSQFPLADLFQQICGSSGLYRHA